MARTNQYFRRHKSIMKYLISLFKTLFRKKPPKNIGHGYDIRNRVFIGHIASPNKVTGDSNVHICPHCIDNRYECPIHCKSLIGEDIDSALPIFDKNIGIGMASMMDTTTGSYSGPFGVKKD